MTGTQIVKSQRSPDELSRLARNHHHQAETHFRSGLKHAVMAGLALNEARERVPQGEWRAWVEERCEIPYFVAAKYQRLAHYRHALAAGPSTLTVSEALKLLNGLPPTDGNNRRERREHAPELRGEAEQLYDNGNGLTVAEIAVELDVHRSVVIGWVNPDSWKGRKQAERRRRAEERAARELLRSRRLASAAKRIGSAHDKGYAELRRALQHFQAVHDTAPNPEARAAARATLTHLQRAEDEVARLLKVWDAS